MILVDYRKGGEAPGKSTPRDMVDCLTRLGVRAELGDLAFGDIAFEGLGPDGPIYIGIERKTLHDMLNCIQNATLSGHQLIGMQQMYDVRVVLLEGYWRPHDPEGWLMEGYRGGTSWGQLRSRGRPMTYSHLYRYLISLSLSGAIVMYSLNVFHTCMNIVEWYHYCQKPWRKHTSMMQMRHLAIPTLQAKPPLIRRWAADIEDIGVTISERAARHFRTPIQMAQATEVEWQQIPGIGKATAQKIVREIQGKK